MVLILRIYGSRPQGLLDGVSPRTRTLKESNFSLHPDMTERIALVEKVRQLPKCDYYTPSHVYRFFRNLRARREQAERATTMNPGMPITSSLK
ncbi:hypothetical protein L226DRAFT_61763 [Lentinus tigrinus ALCF2SS1-7]|uniref:uncharacterized protein n=1 Tax=Lentinus tigrinus ALCF2SS1-7 TaxID=1328758 RepID=UPI001165E439|nr:hypothetical protein L226DRAFT_61763 [Lentinus tigrinus ALCF2SS1-7]